MPTPRFPCVTGALALALSCAAPGIASADEAVTYPPCERQPTEKDVEGAKGAHQAAKQFNDRGDYARAVQYWRDAYALDCTAHLLLLNLAGAYEKQGDKAAAVATLETFLVREPKSPQAATVGARIENLKAAIKAEAKAARDAAEPQGGPADPGGTEGPAPPAAKVTVRADASSGPSGERPFGVLPWVAVGVGGASLIAGGILLPISLGDLSSAEASCAQVVGGQRICRDASAAEAGNAARSRVAISGVLLGAGAAVAASGLIWQLAFNAPRTPARRALIVSPSLGPGRAGIAASGVF